jgi:excisionase family DNA binding protein
MDAELLTTGEVAKLCGVTPDAVLKWIKSGKLPATRTAGGHYRVARRSLATLGLGGLRDEVGPASASHEQARPPARCWEYFGRDGAPLESCRSCLVYAARAQNCYALAQLGEQGGHRRQFCQTECRDCAYYRAGHGMATTVLVVSRDEALTRRLAGQVDPERIALRFARSGYESSTLIGSLRPAVVVMDSDLPEVREGLLPESIMEDERMRGGRVFVALREGDTVTVDRFSAPTLAAPFTGRELEQVVQQITFASGGAA